jgi:flagellar basal body L-ring protein FlgH
MKNEIYNNLLTVFETLTRAQLNAIKQLKKTAGLVEPEPLKQKRMSQIEMIYNILFSAQKAMHVNDIIVAAKQKFDVELDKESIVSALTKRVKRQDRFAKTGPNTFTLIEDIQGGQA